MKGGGGKYDIVRGVGSEYAGSVVIPGPGHGLSTSCQITEPGNSKSEQQPLAGQESSPSPCTVPSILCHQVNWLYLNRADFSSHLKRTL